MILESFPVLFWFGFVFFIKKIPAHLIDVRAPCLLGSIPQTPRNRFKGIKTWSLNFWAILGVGHSHWSVYYLFVAL